MKKTIEISHMKDIPKKIDELAEVFQSIGFKSFCNDSLYRIFRFIPAHHYHHYRLWVLYDDDFVDMNISYGLSKYEGLTSNPIYKDDILEDLLNDAPPEMKERILFHLDLFT